jgi:hypothetical protein
VADEHVEALIHRTELPAIIGALADVVVDVRVIREALTDDEEEEE